MQFEMAVLLILMVVLILVFATMYVVLNGNFNSIFSPIKDVTDPNAIKTKISTMPLNRLGTPPNRIVAF